MLVTDLELEITDLLLRAREVIDTEVLDLLLRVGETLLEMVVIDEKVEVEVEWDLPLDQELKLNKSSSLTN